METDFSVHLSFIPHNACECSPSSIVSCHQKLPHSPPKVRKRSLNGNVCTWIPEKKNGTGKKVAVKASQSDLVLAVLCLGFHSTANNKMTPGTICVGNRRFSFKRKFFKALALKESTRLAYLPRLCLTLHLMHTYDCTQGLR
jgi:hypothetical protein